HGLSCPRSCSCPALNEVHCTFRHLAVAPRNLPRDTERFNLGYNSLTKVEGSEFSYLRQLEMLMLHGNDISTVSPGAFYSLRSLQILKLSYNKLSSLTPGMFEGLVGLVRLYLDHNLIQFIEPYSFNGMASLKLLQLEGNLLSDLHPHSFITLSLLGGNFWSSGLKHLHLADNLLQTLPADTLRSAPRLEVLTLHGNPWTCDCQVHWILEWSRQHEGVIKCKKDRDSISSDTCVQCSSPQPLNGSRFLGLTPDKLPCGRPVLQSPLKQRDSPGWSDPDAEPDLPYTRDLQRPLGHLTFVLSDSHGNTAHVACDVRRPGNSSSVAWEGAGSPGELSVNVTVATQLECEINRDALQNLWRLVAYYYEFPAVLERGQRPDGANANTTTYQYSQGVNEESPYFTDLKGHLMAQPSWLLQPRVTLQLNRPRTTTKKLVMDFTTVVSKHVTGRRGWAEEEGEEADDVTSSWALIRRGSPGRIRTVLEGSEVRLDCEVISSGSEVKVEWMLPDLTVLERGTSDRMETSERGELVVLNATASDSGLYHCLVRTPAALDLLPVRLTVRERLLTPAALNGREMAVAVGGSLSLPCHVTSAQPSQTSWYLPQSGVLRPTQQASRVSVSADGTLRIQKATRDDAGEYSCLASNLHGVDMLSHRVVVTGGEDSDRSAVETEKEEPLLLGGEEIGEGSGMGYQEIKRDFATESPKRAGGHQRTSGGVLRPYPQGKRVKDPKRKPNKSVKELDPNRWAEILAKANAKTPTALPTAQSLTELAAAAVTTVATTAVAAPQPTATATTTTTETTPAMTAENETEQNPQEEERESKLQSSDNGGGVGPPLPRRPLYGAVTVATTASPRGEKAEKGGTADSREDRDDGKKDVEEKSRGKAESPGRGPEVTNRPEITAETAGPTVGVSGPVEFDLPPGPRRHGHSRTPYGRDHLMLSKLRGRYRQAQLDRIAQLRRKVVTPKPRLSYPLAPKAGQGSQTAKPQLRFPLANPTPGRRYPAAAPKDKSLKAAASTSSSFHPFPTAFHHPFTTPASFQNGGRWPHRRTHQQGGSLRPTALPPLPRIMGNAGRGEGKPRITTVTSASVLTLAESDVYLSCEASGDPTPAMSWTKVSTGATIPANTKHGSRFEVLQNGTFVIRSVQLQDRGQYLCTAHNRLGSDRMVITLAVQTQPPKILGTSPSEVAVYLDRTVNLDCLASGKPPAQISWILPDKTFVREPGSAQTRPHVLLANGTLRIQSVSFANKGQYKCIASNAAGADTLTYNLRVAALPPSIEEGGLERVSVAPGRSVYVHCSTKGEPPPALRWTLPSGDHVKPSQILGRRLFVFPNGTLHLRRAAPEDAGRYECAASNAVGVAKRTLHLEVGRDAATPGLPSPRQRAPPAPPPLPLPLPLPPYRPSQRPSQQHRVTAMYGSTVYLHCPESKGTPRGTLWQLPSKTLLEHRYSPERPARAFPNGTLRILQLTEVDGGNYLCLFQRPNGEDMELFQVEVLMTPPRIEHLGTSQTRVPYGDNFRVDCVATGLPDPEVTWSLPDGTMINNALQSDDSGLRSRRYVIFDNGTLLLQQMGKKDEGEYTCYAKNHLGEVERKVRVRVGPEAPRISSKQHRGPIRTRHGEAATLTCQATGDPPPSLTWISPSKEVVSPASARHQLLSDGTLVVRRVSGGDEGEYVCVARNVAGEDFLRARLEIEASQPLISGARGRSTAKVLAVSYQTTLLDCPAEGHPTPRVTWATPSGLSLATPYLGGRFQVHGNGSLELRGVRRSDEGSYVCLARNSHGEASLAVHLEVSSLAEKPSFASPNIEILPIKQDGGDVVLECPARGKPCPEFTWILPNGTALNPTSRLRRFTHHPGNGTLRISQPVPTDKGVYRCVARNVAGQAEKRYSLEAGRKPLIRSSAGGMKITYGQSLSLHCVADGWPLAAISWTLPNGLVLDKPQLIGRVAFLTNGTLQLREVATFDRGTYLCRASNAFGSSTLSYPVAVMVFPPRITSAPASITRIPRGSPVGLDCLASGIPKPDITWTLPGRTTLVPRNRFTVQGGVHMTEEGRLVIQEAMLMHSGIYKCNAKNALGTDFKATYLQVV
ncbi:LOW QUALITY PROTEIN: matrix-remodeling-associated protein 5, partial [Aplochiton taeniatus]